MSFPTVKKAVDSLPGITAPLKSVTPPAPPREPEFVFQLCLRVNCSVFHLTLLHYISCDLFVPGLNDVSDFYTELVIFKQIGKSWSHYASGNKTPDKFVLKIGKAFFPENFNSIFLVSWIKAYYFCFSIPTLILSLNTTNMLNAGRASALLPHPPSHVNNKPMDGRPARCACGDANSVTVLLNVLQV